MATYLKTEMQLISNDTCKVATNMSSHFKNSVNGKIVHIRLNSLKLEKKNIV